ncbi:isoflavone reductase family protein [Lojkania enalia]|uniref:Isoflavone reductase family protein n=1 Tax=Lojkania enalia TaxID=147567 RepID=A0A9P4K5L1_9PLEO|nr:isoflavone reductase family protein [Didymosphaeria enalia]
MAKQSVLLLGATGETGGSILEGLLENGSFDITCLVQPSSSTKSSVQALRNRGLKIVIGDLNGSVEALAEVVRGFNTIISAISPPYQMAQIALVDAVAMTTTTSRFVPCAFTTVCPPGGVMHQRDEKEIVYQRIWGHHLPYTIIDVGYWHQFSFPRIPSGRFDYAMLLPRNDIYGDGNVPNLMSDLRDIGKFVARIVRDERTINKKVVAYSDVLSQNDVVAIVEEKSGEKVEVTHVTEDEAIQRRDKARVALEAYPSDNMNTMARWTNEYNVSKYVRKDNTLENAKYLGYIDARELYPDFQPIRFETFVQELLQGEAKKLYAGKF